MQINQVNVYPISLPFSAEFSHSLRKRTSAQNVVVEIIADKGAIIGYGEGAPRSYVTGETQDSVGKRIRALTRQSHFPWQLDDVSQIWNFIDGLSPDKTQNSAVCALETALLDTLGKGQRQNIIEYFPKAFYRDTVYYHATLPLTHQKRIMDMCRLCQDFKINALRIKMGNDFKQNKETMEAIHAVFGDDYDLRVDINGIWNREIALRHIPLFNQYKVKILEQPLVAGDPYIAEFARLMQNYGIILMADESVCTLNEAEKVSREGYYKMINVRLSKCGGFRNSLNIINFLRQNDLHFQLGCHLGESGILSAAGRVLCLLCHDALYCDGSYDIFLLKENLTTQNVSFGLQGRAAPLRGPGLGVEVDRQRLKRFSQNSKRISISDR